MVQRIRLSQISGSVCARRSCRQVFEGTDLPSGWRHIVMAQGSLLEAKDLLNAEWDGVLCAEHFKEIQGLVESGDKRCSREGCTRALIGDTVPSGWRHIVLSRGLLFEADNLLRADFDGWLCSDHYREIDDLLKPRR